MVDPACKFNEKGIREKNDGKEVPEEIKKLGLDPKERVKADE